MKSPYVPAVYRDSGTTRLYQRNVRKIIGVINISSNQELDKLLLPVFPHDERLIYVTADSLFSFMYLVLLYKGVMINQNTLVIDGQLSEITFIRRPVGTRRSLAEFLQDLSRTVKKHQGQVDLDLERINEFITVLSDEIIELYGTDSEVPSEYVWSIVTSLVEDFVTSYRIK